MSLQKTDKCVLTLLTTLVLLPGCSFLNKKSEAEDTISKDGGGVEILISEKGNPILTEKEFDNFLEQATEADPQAKMMLSMMPELIKEQALEAKKRAAIISAWARDEGVRDTQDYKNKKDLIIRSVQESLDNEAFMKKHKAEVTDKETKEFYDENKLKDSRFQILPEGTKAFGVEFDTKAKAEEFLDKKVKPKISDIENVAKDLKTRDFGIVNKDSYAPKAIKNAVLAAKVPSAQVVKDDNKFWVVAALSKEKAKYHSFDDLKDGIKSMLEGQKAEATMEQELPKYEKKFGIKVNQDYVKKLNAKKEEREKELKEQFAPTQPEHNENNVENNVEKNVKELAQTQAKTSGAA